MQRRIRYRMELYVLTDYFVFFAVNDNFNVSVIKTERIQSFGQFNRIQADEFGLFAFSRFTALKLIFVILKIP